jgi:elongin-A
MYLVIRRNRARIWDIGDLEYGLIKPFLDELPIEQLVEIEDNSPVGPVAIHTHTK